MAKSTPSQTFAKIFAQFTHPSTPPETRKNAERKMDSWLAKNGKTRADIHAILIQAAIDDGAVKAPPTTSADPRDAAPNPFDDPAFDPASVVEGLVVQYATMGEHERVIYTLAVVFTHVFKRYAITPRIALVSEEENSGKSILLELARMLVLRANEDSLSTGPAIIDHIDEGAAPGTICADELDLYDAEALRWFKLVWNLGHWHKAKRALMVKGRRKLVDLNAPMFAAGIGDIFRRTQKSRTFTIEMTRFTQETKPPREFYVDIASNEPDAIETIANINGAYTYLHYWSAGVELNPRPAMPDDIITRYADNARGLVAVADACGLRWGERARAAVWYFMRKDMTEHPKITIIRHGLVIFETLDVEFIRSERFNKELRSLALPDANWNRYRGASNADYAHAITPDEQAKLLEMAGIRSENRRHDGKRGRGYTHEVFKDAARRHGVTPDDVTTARARLRLISGPSSD